MSNLMRRGMFYDPFPAFENLAARLNADSLSWPMESMWRQEQVLDQEDHTLIRMDVPGISREDLQIELSGNLLRVKGTRNDRQEGRYAAFQQIERSWTVPAGTSKEDIKANLENGVLEISVAKKTTQAIQIPVGETLQLDQAKEEKPKSKKK